MFAALRAELKAIVEWDKKGFASGTETEKDAIVFRQRRRREIARQLIEIVSKN